MSGNPYESPKVPSRPPQRIVDEKAIDKQLRPWVSGALFLGVPAAVFVAIQIPGASKFPMGTVGLCIGVIVGLVVSPGYVIGKSLLTSRAPLLEEDESWLPR